MEVYATSAIQGHDRVQGLADVRALKRKRRRRRYIEDEERQVPDGQRDDGDDGDRQGQRGEGGHGVLPLHRPHSPAHRDRRHLVYLFITFHSCVDRRLHQMDVCRYTPKYQRTYANTEACYLAIKHAFEFLRYRRVEWKCGTDWDSFAL